MGGCVGKSSYGPWRSNTPPSENNKRPAKKKRNKLYVTINDGKSTENMKDSDNEISNKNHSKPNENL